MPTEELRRLLDEFTGEDEQDLRNNPLKFVRHPVEGIIPLRPFKKQQEFLDRLAAPGLRIMGWDGPNRAGKSMAAAMAVVEILTGLPVGGWPDLPGKLNRRHLGPPRHIGCITVTRQKSIDSQQRYLAARFPENLLHCKPWSEKTGFGSTNPKLILKNGSTVDFLSDLQREQSLEAFQWDLAWIDEAIDEWAYKRIIARLVDTRGKLIITAVAEKAWIHRVLRLKLMTMESEEPVDDGLIDTIDNSSMSDNELISEQSIEEAIRMWGGKDSRETKMRVFGQYVHLEGVILTTYSDIDHVRPTVAPDRAWTFYELIDPGFRNPFAISFIAVDAYYHKHVFHEIYVRGKLVPEVANLIKQVRDLYGYGEPYKAIIDPAASQASEWGKTKISIRQELSDHGIRTLVGHSKPGSVVAGQQILRAEIAAGRLSFQAHCKWHRFEAQNWKYAEADKVTGEFLADKEKEIDAHNHLLKAIIYGYTCGMGYVPQSSEPPVGSSAYIIRKQQAAADAARDNMWDS